MARILMTAAVADIRGKLAGSVFARNKGGAYIRTKVTPINPKTSYQSLQRSYVSNLAKYYATTMSVANRLAWTNWGKSTTAKSIFGEKLILSGVAAFQKVNLIILSCGGSQINTPPLNNTVTSILTAALVANHTGPLLTLTYTPTPQAGTVGTYVWATPTISPGISNFNSQLRFILFTAASASPLELHVAWIARFGAFPVAA